jgi:dipeptidyl aminopeptidase/acylaminoacyl peptidase
MKFFKQLCIVLLMAGLAISAGEAKEKKKFTFQDVMQFKNLLGAVISYDGSWIGYYEKPERGNPTAIIKSTQKDSLIYKVEKGTNVSISRNSKWATVKVLPDKLDLENKKGADKPKNSMTLVNLANSKKDDFENIDKYEFSNDSKWLAYKKSGDEKNTDKKKRIIGSPLYLRHLESESEIAIQNVTEFAFDSVSKNIAFVVAEKEAKQNGVFYIDLTGEIKYPQKIVGEKNIHFSSLAWNHNKDILAFVMGKERKSGAPDSCVVATWDNKGKSFSEIINTGNMIKEWYIPFKNNLSWSEDGERLFFGLRPMIDTIPEEEEFKYTDSTYTDINSILKNTELDLWHWKDPMIKTNRKNFWDTYQNESYKAVYHLNKKKIIQLADQNLQEVTVNDNSMFAVGFDSNPYMREMTWDGEYKDIYSVNIQTGEKKLVKKRVQYDVELSPFGNYILYFDKKQWYLYNNNTNQSRCLTDSIPLPFYDADWDMPADPTSYGTGGWFVNDEEVLINSKWDIYRFTTKEPGWLCQTAADGKLNNFRFRIVNLDPEKKFYKANDYAFIEGFSYDRKTQGLFKTEFNILGMLMLIDSSEYFYNLIAESKESKNLLFTREKYNEFPDLWLYDTTFTETKRLTTLSSQIDSFNWGTTEQIKWLSFDGDTLEGFYVKPENFDKKKKYPVLIYFYERMSDGAKRFVQPGNMHRPCYPVYTGDDYIIFLPDVKYRDGYPGRSSLSALVSGSKALGVIGVADTDRVALWGHSWSGYQASYIITQTDFFKCAVAGAPVGNMTSAYSGVRLESGRARQFQYEKWQSRIGGNLWDSLGAYLRNSPVFYANRANTPLMIEFGDIDDAVPWQQGIELFLALRRADKPVVMLEYRNEPHIPRKYQNKLDYAVRMKEFYDHYLLGKPAPKWLTDGIEYRGK